MKRVFAILLCALVLVSCGDSGNTDSDNPSQDYSMSVSGSSSESPDNGLVKKKVTNDASGNLISTVSYEYDVSGNLIKETETDADGNVKSVTEYTFSSGRQDKVTYLDGSGNVTGGFQYVYGDDGRIELERHNDGTTVKYTYNDKGLLGMQDYGTNQVIFRYTDSGVLGQRIVASGDNNILAVTDYSYYEDGKLATESENTSSGVYKLQYTYDGDKMKTAVLTDPVGVVLQNIEYIY